MNLIRLLGCSALCLCLTGCLAEITAASAVVAAVFTGYNTYDAVTERKQSPVITGCEGWKRIRPGDGYRERWTESEIAQALNNNKAYLCTCEKREEFCERKD